MISDQRYLNWQKELASRIFFRRFWVFWAVYSVILIFCAVLYLLTTRQLKVVVVAFDTFLLGRFIVSPLIYLFYKKQRPFQKLNFEIIKSRLFSPSVKRPNSFPSDHAISFAAIITVIIYYFPLLGICLIAVGVLNGTARVILGHHYVIDILAGWIIGALSALIVIYWLAPRLFTR